MDPFGNFAWNFGFGFGWILIGVFALLMAAAIIQIVRSGFRDEQKRVEEQAALDALKQEICSNRISLEEFGKKIKNMA